MMAPNGLRLARETLEAPRAVTAFTPLDTDDIKGQSVRVFDAATGEVVLETPASPVLDAGGNVAFSPTARRVAVLNAGAIQIFELPAPPPLPSIGASSPASAEEFTSVAERWWSSECGFPGEPVVEKLLCVSPVPKCEGPGHSCWWRVRSVSFPEAPPAVAPPAV